MEAQKLVRFIIAAAWCFSVGSMLVPAPGTAQVTGGRYREPVVFQRTMPNPPGGEREISYKIWVMESDGSRQQQLSFGTNYDDHPSLFSDLIHVLYAEFPVPTLDRSRDAVLVKLNMYTGERSIAASLPGFALHHASVSPLNDEVVYSKDNARRRTQWIGLGADAREIPTVSTNGVAMPDGVIFMHDWREVSPRRVALARLYGLGKGARMVLLTGADALHRRPAVSPDGARLAWQSDAVGGNDEILIAGIDAANPVNLTRAAGNDGHPWFSRDGRWIVFESDRTGHWEIWKLNVETRQTVRLTHDDGVYENFRPRM